MYGHVVRITDDTLCYHDRLAAILEAHLSNGLSRPNEVMKFLTIFSVVLMPMGVLIGLHGTDVPVVHFPGGERLQFWWIVGMMAAMSGVLVPLFPRSRWL